MIRILTRPALEYKLQADRVHEPGFDTRPPGAAGATQEASFVVECRTGRVIKASPSSLARIESLPSLEFARGHLSFRSESVQRQFESHLAGASAGQACNGVMAWRDSGAGLSCSAVFRPAGAPGAVAVELRTSDARAGVPEVKAFAKAHALSAAETELLELCIAGLELVEIADRKGLLLTTVRQRMKTVLAKTQCRRQVELMRAVLTLFPPRMAG